VYDAMAQARMDRPQRQVASARVAERKVDLEQALGQLVLVCFPCGPTVHWVAGIGSTFGTGRTRTPPRTTIPPSRTGLWATPGAVDPVAAIRLPLWRQAHLHFRLGSDRQAL
jgi:hypothetical protein